MALKKTEEKKNIMTYKRKYSIKLFIGHPVDACFLVIKHQAILTEIYPFKCKSSIRDETGSISFLTLHSHKNTHQAMSLCLSQQTHQHYPLPPGVHCCDDLSEGAYILAS